MGPLNEPPGWRTELRWGVATIVSTALCLAALPLVPVMWAVGRWGRGADR